MDRDSGLITQHHLVLPFVEGARQTIKMKLDGSSLIFLGELLLRNEGPPTRA